MNGTVIVDKPAGKTSFDVVHEIRHLLHIKKIGHTGTLDPLTTGVLPVCINEATKLIRFFTHDDKEYRATMLLGVETDTFDTEGAVVARKKPAVTDEEIQHAIKSFTGKIEQRVPKYSAVKIQGKPLYRWTREGIDITPPVRTIEIYRIAIETIALPYVTFVVACSKGTYIRSLCADIGHRLGCGACLYRLRRIKSGHFGEESAIILDGFDKEKKERSIRENLIPMVDMLPHFCSVTIDAEIAGKIKNGCHPGMDMLNGCRTVGLREGDIIKFVSADRQIVAIARMLLSSEEIGPSYTKDSMVKILRVFNN
jgi:tRNA pseudouridine55 synthase